MAETASKKRPHSDCTDDAQPHKKIKIRRRLRHIQHKPQHIEPAPQDPVFVQSLLLRNISAVLAMVGFDSVKPTALEMFRASVEEYMLTFLHSIRTSMSTNRRTRPTPQDFASALSLMPNTSSASLLVPQLKLPIPDAIACPPIPEPEQPPAPAPDFSALLQPLLVSQTPAHIPKHFPQLPPQHAWKRTPVFPQREDDARKMRERATEEGILAEQALRKLAAAAKNGAVKAEQRRESVLSGHGRKVTSGKQARRRNGDGGGQEEMFGDMMREIGVDGPEEQQAMELDTERVKELREEDMDVGMPEGVLVNWDTGGWRRGGRKALRL